MQKNVPPGGTGRYADGDMTKDSSILRQMSFAGTCKVDKGFLVNNEAMTKGIVIGHPQTCLCHQVQQLSVDTS